MYMALSPNLLVLLCAVLLGVIFCVIWVFLRSLSCVFSLNKKINAALDIVFCFIIATSTLLFLFRATDGQFRLFIFIGQGIGFLISYLLFYNPVFALFKKLILTLKKIISFVFKPIMFIVRLIAVNLFPICKQIINKLKTFCVKAAKLLIYPIKKLYLK